MTDEAVDALLGFLGAEGAVDPYLADQLLLPLALASRESMLTTSRVSAHLLTNAEVIRDFLPVTLDIRGELGRPGCVRLGSRGGY